MGYPALHLQQPAPAWHNPVPAWIRASDLYTDDPFADGRNQRRNRTDRTVLETIADHCDAPDTRGTLIGAFGPKFLAADAGVSVASFWRSLKRLERRGFVITLARGGVLGANTRIKRKRHIANTFGIPGAPGLLDHLRARRREQRMAPTGQHDARGRPIYAPDIIKPGDQATLFRNPRQPQPEEAGYSRPGQIGGFSPQAGPPPHSSPAGDMHHRAPQSAIPPAGGSQTIDTTPPPPHPRDGPGIDTTLVSQGHDPSVALTHHLNHDHHDESHGQNHGARCAKSNGSRREPLLRRNAFGGPCIGHIDREELLGDVPALLRLFERERRRGAMRCTAIQFVAAAVRARRVVHKDGGDALRLFASLVNRELWGHLSEDDLAQARRWLDSHALSPDAEFVRAAIWAAKQKGLGENAAFRTVQTMRSGWTRARFDAAVKELDEKHGART